MELQLQFHPDSAWNMNVNFLLYNFVAKCLGRGIAVHLLFTLGLTNRHIIGVKMNNFEK